MFRELIVQGLRDSHQMMGAVLRIQAIEEMSDLPGPVMSWFELGIGQK
mgnify:CR=1 FL=1|jgi:hypothetical protein